MKKNRLCHSFFKRPWRKILVIMKLFFLFVAMFLFYCCSDVVIDVDPVKIDEMIEVKDTVNS